MPTCISCLLTLEYGKDVTKHLLMLIKLFLLMSEHCLMLTKQFLLGPKLFLLPLGCVGHSHRQLG